MIEYWHEVVLFASGLGIGAALVSLGDKMLSWFFYHKVKRLEAELQRLEEDLEVLRMWREK